MGSAMTVTRHHRNGQLIIEVTGDFTFAFYEQYTEALDEIKNSAVSHVAVDLKGVSFIDSSALGLLLLTREECEEQGKELTLLNPKGKVKEMIDISQFNDLFSITDTAP